MNNNSKPYAEILYKNCKSSAFLRTIQKEMNSIAYLFKKVPAFRRVLISKRIDNANKYNIIKSSLNKFNPIIIEFLSVIINHNHSNQLLDIISRFNHLIKTKSDIQEVNITTAYTLEQSYLDKIALDISTIVGGSPKINYTEKTEIIGGIKLRIGNKIFDNSILYQLKQLKKTLHNM